MNVWRRLQRIENCFVRDGGRGIFVTMQIVSGTCLLGYCRRKEQAISEFLTAKITRSFVPSRRTKDKPKNVIILDCHRCDHNEGLDHDA